MKVLVRHVIKHWHGPQFMSEHGQARMRTGCVRSPKGSREKRELTVRQLEPARLSKPKRFVMVASSCNKTLSKLTDRLAAW